MIVSNASGSIWATGPPPATPALAMTTSSPPKRSAASSTADAIASRSETSASKNAVSPPSSDARCSSSSGSSPASAIRAPLARSCLAASAPMPRAAPVMKMVLPCRLQLIRLPPPARTEFAPKQSRSDCSSSCVVPHQLLHRVDRLVGVVVDDVVELHLLVAALRRRHRNAHPGADQHQDEEQRQDLRRAALPAGALFGRPGGRRPRPGAVAARQGPPFAHRV